MASTVKSQEGGKKKEKNIRTWRSVPGCTSERERGKVKGKRENSVALLLKVQDMLKNLLIYYDELCRCVP